MIKRRSLYTITFYFNLVGTIIAFLLMFDKTHKVLSQSASILFCIFLIITIISSIALNIINRKITNELHAKQLEEIIKKHS